VSPLDPHEHLLRSTDEWPRRHRPWDRNKRLALAAIPGGPRHIMTASRRDYRLDRWERCAHGRDRRGWAGHCRLQAIKRGARETGKKIKQRFEPSFSLIARLILRTILMLMITLFAPLLLVFAVFHDWLMKKFINYAYIYNVSWEDPRMDQQVRIFDLKHFFISSINVENVLLSLETRFRDACAPCVGGRCVC
jgi:hypothetical protein